MLPGARSQGELHTQRTKVPSPLLPPFRLSSLLMPCPLSSQPHTTLSLSTVPTLTIPGALLTYLCREFSSKELHTVGNYALSHLIGKGSFGKVYLASHKLISGSRVSRQTSHILMTSF